MSNENLPPRVLKSLMQDIRKITKHPTEGIRVFFSEDNMTNIFAEIQGPVGTPYETGVFKLKLVLGGDFPAAPPKGFFITNIFHPNVSKAGEICVNTLKRDWKESLGIMHVLTVIKCLLIVPNPASALNEEAGKLLLENYDDFAKRAALMTKIHAKPKGVKSSSSSSSQSSSSAASSSSTSSAASTDDKNSSNHNGKENKQEQEDSSSKDTSDDDGNADGVSKSNTADGNVSKHKSTSGDSGGAVTKKAKTSSSNSGNVKKLKKKKGLKRL